VKKAFGTPQIIDVSLPGKNEKQAQLVSTTSKAVLAYEPMTGKEIWRVRYSEFSSATRPLFDGKHVFTNTGFSKGKLLAIEAGGQGDITKTHVAWEAAKAIGSKPSPLLIGTDLICTLDDRGVLTAMKRLTGELVWQERLGGDFSSSPILAGGRIYCFDEKGKGHVFSTDGKALAENTLEAGCLASPAVLGDDLVVRTRTSLYCISAGTK
jgi:outer membrane protein assembly factor BamB